MRRTVQADVMIKHLVVEKAITIYTLEKIAGRIRGAKYKHFAGEFDQRRMDSNAPDYYFKDWDNWQRATPDVLEVLRAEKKAAVSPPMEERHYCYGFGFGCLMAEATGEVESILASEFKGSGWTRHRFSTGVTKYYCPECSAHLDRYAESIARLIE